ncbi:LysR family transcriptional regulator [Actinoplanes sp. NBRC 101535]|uniref:LysR family transcriptional regulator n=1 Tax=Actinoplanes sp. NBRC 101535 TaxID=3032196 RepID=UPI0024A5A862|nr:LysR family transcriptional regulator [Actinoplanes sp. NBRC 101535]GLY03000.1 LysR family transcriptional regulator [Actinoplanes sp. NBRC 101535]
MLDARRLQLLHDLDRLGTIARVAQARSYTPSAVSQQLTALEREAGVPLLERTGRSVRLTAAGRVLVRHAATVLAALEEADAALAAVRSGPAGPIRIGAFPSAMRTLLPRVLVALGTQHPALELAVTELDPSLVPVALRDRTLDVGLIHDYDVVPAPDDPLLEQVPLLSETVFLASTSDISDMSVMPWILATPGTLCHEVTLRVCAAAGFTPRVRHHADDFGTVLALVAAGQGVSLVPALAAADPPDGVRLTALETRRRTRAACRRGDATRPAVAAVIGALLSSAPRFPGDVSLSESGVAAAHGNQGGLHAER